MAFPIISFFILGLIIGSFLNTVIWRTHESWDKKKKFSVAKGRSVCPHCGHQLAAIDLIPVVSFLTLRGRCRYCKKPISWQYPLVEFLTAIIFVALYWHFKPANSFSALSLVVWLIVAGLVIAAAVYDLRWLKLPDKFLLPTIGIAFTFVLIADFFFHQNILLPRLLAALIFAGIFFFLWFFSNGRWMGDGDIRLALIMGLLLSLPQLLVAILFAFNLGALIALILLILKIKKRQDVIPFGPFLILGTFIGLLYGDIIMRWYSQIFS